MDISLAESMARYEIRKWILGWTLRWTKSKGTFGTCCYSEKVIELSRPLTFYNEQSEVLDTVLHEIAHALAGAGHGHDRVWKSWCVKVGARPVRCYDPVEVHAGEKYALYCAVCRKVVQRTNRIRSNVEVLYHKKCGRSSLGKLKYYQVKP